MKTLRMFGSIAVASMLAFGLAACGDDNPSGSKDDDSSSSVVEECDGGDCDEDSGKSSDSKDDGKSSSSKKDEKSSSSSATGPSVVSKGEVKDSRDGKVYKTVKIGAQTWMAENLAYKTADSKCSSGDSDCKNGRLYHWADVMDLGVAANTSSAAMFIKSRNKGICPEGFHVPNKSDYERLFTQPWVDDVFHSYFVRENGKFEYIDHPTDAESLVFGSDEECKMILSANSSYKESDLKSCNLYKFNGSLHKNEKDNVDYWTALESGDDKALGASLLNAKYVFGEKAFSSKSDMNYLRCVSDEELCGGKELQDNQYCYNDKVYEKAKPGDGVCDEFAADDAQLEGRCYGPKDSEGLVAYSPVKFYEDGGKFYPLCGGKKLADGMFCVAGEAYEKCNGRAYDLIREFCRGNVVVAFCDTIGDNQFCVDGFVYDKCGGEKYDVTKEKCVNDVVNRMCGTSYYLHDKQFCVEKTVYDKCGGKEYDVTKEKCVNDVLYPACGSSYYIPGGNARCQNDKVIELSYGELKDSRDGQIYKTIRIGDQTWMAENLNYQIVTSKCYGDKPENCEKYGRLYTWDDAKKACPAGWHLPSDAEFESLLATVGTSNAERSLNLRADSWKNGSDMYGFSALPAGHYYSHDKEFYDLGSYTFFWTSTELSSVNASFLYILGYNNIYSNDKSNGYSVRCLQD